VNLRPQGSGGDRSKPGGDTRVSTQVNKEWWSPKELQGWLGCGKTLTYELLNNPNGIPNYRIGRKIFVRRQDVIAWLEEKRYHPGGLW
jgi:excisionase family DNA binding protein